MQNNDSRLIKAAKRGICAEVTLIIVIVVIASWSVYGLYKLAFGLTDNLFGFSLTKLAATTTDNNGQAGKQAFEQQALEQKISKNLSSQLQSGNKQQVNTQHHPIYSASNPIHSHSHHHHPLATINSNSINSLVPSDLNLIHLTNLLNKQHNGQFIQPNQLITNARLIDPTTNNNILGSSNFVPTYQAPVGRATKSYEPLTSSPDDYEVASAGANFDYSNDRQPEESSRDPGESIVDNSSQSSEDEEQHDNTTPAPEVSQGDTSNRDDEESSTPQPETTTSSDSAVAAAVALEVPELTNEDNSDQDINKDQTDSTSNKDSNEQHSQDTDEEKEEPANEGNTPSPEDEESAKATSLSIDEEVDRMTQPSLSSVLQQDRPPRNLNRNTVQFDDLPNISSIERATKSPRSDYNRTTLEQSAHANSSDMMSIDPEQRTKHEEMNINDDITIRVKPVQSKKKSPHSSIQTIINYGKSRKMAKDDERDGQVREKFATDKSMKNKTSILYRQRRHLIPITEISVPRNIDGFFNNLDISNIIEESFENPEGTSERPLKDSKLTNRMSIQSDLADGFLDMASSEAIGQKMIAPDGKKKRKRTSLNGLIKRSDEEEDDEAGDDTGEGESEESESSARSNLAVRKIAKVGPRHNHIMSNDTALQELLKSQYLFDALRNGQSQMQSNQTGAANTTNSQAINGVGQVSVTGATDPQLASSLYSIEHGLDPASNEEHSMKTKKKKKKKKKYEKKKEKKKHKKKKEKKKMTEGMKKGGHKKRKHKKEEKKYIKEKKFKGAKKGKKVSKGKGGQGGKKGKKLYKDKGFKKKGFKNVYHKEEFGQKKSYFDEFRDKDFKKKWKNFKDKYDYAQMKKWQAKDIKGAKKMKDHGEKYKKHEDGKWKKKYHKHSKENSESSKKHKKSDEF